MEQSVERSVVPEVVELIPVLRAYARSLCRNTVEADDLVQDTLVKAIANIEKFQPGTRLRAWLFTIMRNTFYTSVHLRAREQTGAQDDVSDSRSVLPTQEWSVRGKELMAAIDRLPPHYREMIIVVVMLGESYDDAAKLFGCAIGTVKSRVNRARQMVIADLGPDEIDRIAPRSKKSAPSLQTTDRPV